MDDDLEFFTDHFPQDQFDEYLNRGKYRISLREKQQTQLPLRLLAALAYIFYKV